MGESGAREVTATIIGEGVKHLVEISNSVRTVIEAPDFIGVTEMGVRTKMYIVIRDADTLKLKTMHPGLPKDIRGY